MTVRAVEWKRPYTWGKAIEITEDKVINLRLRSENNLIIYDEGDDEIYVDLQLPDGIKPLDTFPVGITTGRVLVADNWDVNWTIVCFMTTSGDNIKLLYWDDWKLYIDNWTWVFKQIYLKWEVDALLQALRDYVDYQLSLKQDKLIAWENITIDTDGKTINAVIPPLSRFLSLWDCATGMPLSFPTSDLPFEYITGDHFLVGNVDDTAPIENFRPSGTEYTGQASVTVETEEVQVWDLYIYDWAVWLLQLNHERQVTFSNIAWSPYDNTNLANALNNKADDTDLNTKLFTNHSDAIEYYLSGKECIYRDNNNVTYYPTSLTISGTDQTIRFVTTNLTVSWDAVSFSYMDATKDWQWNYILSPVTTVSINGVPTTWNTWDVLTKTANGYAFATPTWWVSMSTTTATLTTNWWSSNTQTVNVTGVTANNTVIISPDPTSISDYASSSIYCSAQGSGTLTFTCGTTPTSAITVNVVILS